LLVPAFRSNMPGIQYHTMLDPTRSFDQKRRDIQHLK